MISTFLAQRNSQDKIIGRRFKFIAFLILIFILIGCTGGSETEKSTQPESAKLVILHTNDMHAQYIPLNAFWIEGDVKPLIGGFGALDAYIKREREKGLPILLMDAGDLMTGTLLSEKEVEGVKGGALFKMMNEMGYDIMTLGNHEFDNGQENVA
ncbi:MAG: metallophosphoesterase, partial [Candidatus Marinimicrobia bacterium]|nr:metallophosphoesterase [Candidatus Neomarinimicrobiota bacterium]